MERAAELIADKIKYLEKLHKINEEELLNFAEGKFETLEVFYNSREGILSIIQKIDSMIKGVDSTCDFKVAEASDAVKKSIVKNLNYKNDLVTEILSQDLQILSYIESEKSSIIRELSQVRTVKKVINSYSSGHKARSIDEEI